MQILSRELIGSTIAESVVVFSAVCVLQSSSPCRLSRSPRECAISVTLSSHLQVLDSDEDEKCGHHRIK